MAVFQTWESTRQSLESDRRIHTMSSCLLRALVSLGCMLVVLGTVAAQVQDSIGQTRPKPQSQDTAGHQGTMRPTETAVRQRDTVASLAYITPGDFYGSQDVLHDTLTGKFHQYDPARQSEYPYATLGNLGSPARRLYFDMPQPKSVHTGHFAFDLYKSDFSAFRFYETDVALTRLNYAQGINQEDGIFNAQFGKNFDNGINFSINYQRINQLGIYNNQRAKNTAFGTGLLYRSPSGRLDGIYHYQSNSIIHEDNGGVDTASLNSDRLPLNVIVSLNDALTTHREREFTAQHHLHLLASQNDTIERRAQIDFIHTLRFGSGFVKFADTKYLTSEADDYAGFVTDERGIRNFISTKTLDNSLDIQFRYRGKSPGTPGQLLRVGLQLIRTRVDQEPREDRRQDIFLNASAQLGISPTVSLDGAGYLGVLDAAGTYGLKGNARLKLFRDARTWVNLTLYQRNPTLTESRVFVNQIPVWDHDFKNVALSTFQFYYIHPSLKIRMHGATHLLSNGIFYGADRMPYQFDQSIKIIQISAAKELLVGHLGLDAQLMWQKYDADELALPNLMFNGQLFYTGRWFKQQLLVRAGIDLLVTDDYPGVSYFPVTGQFYYQPDFPLTTYPGADVFFSMQVKDIFRAFFKVENVASYFRDDHYVQVNGYPRFAGYFRFGLWMKLFD